MELLRVVWSIVWSPLWILVLHPWWRWRERSTTWVIGGHRGRLYADNASEVERAARETGERTLFIANAPLLSLLRQRGVPAVRRHSWAARRAISTARVLIYSHGEDDLDLMASLVRGRSCLRVYLNHSLNFLKAGGVTDPHWNRGGFVARALRRWLLTDSDVILAASPAEIDTLRAAYPKRSVRLGGGAHLEAWRREATHPPVRRLYWFPTFRDTRAANQRLAEVISEVTSSDALRAWLIEHHYELFIGTHVNLAQRGLPQLSPPFFARSPRDLVSDVAASEVLVSDYSGIIFDYLLLERPQVHFAFDRDDYLKRRALFTGPEDMPFALHVDTLEGLVDTITSEAFRDERLLEAARKARAHYLPNESGDFAKASVRAIEELLVEVPRGR